MASIVWPIREVLTLTTYLAHDFLTRVQAVVATIALLLLVQTVLLYAPLSDIRVQQDMSVAQLQLGRRYDMATVEEPVRLQAPLVNVGLPSMKEAGRRIMGPELWLLS